MLNFPPVFECYTSEGVTKISSNKRLIQEVIKKETFHYTLED